MATVNGGQLMVKFVDALRFLGACGTAPSGYQDQDKQRYPFHDNPPFRLYGCPPQACCEAGYSCSMIGVNP